MSPNQPPSLIPGVYLTDKNLAAILDVSRGQVWAMVKNLHLPPPVRLSARTTRWKSDDVIAKLNQAA